MATAAAPRGKTIDFLMKAESIYGTPPSGNWTKTFIYSHTLAEKRPMENDPLLGVTRQNNRDTTSPSPGLPQLDGQVVAPLDINHIGYWLKKLFGAPSTSGASDFTHVFSSGLEVLPHDSAEVKLASNIFLQYTGLIASTFAIDIERKPGYDRATIGLMGRKETKLTSTAGGTPAAALARIPFAAALATFKIDGVVAADIMSLQATYDNKVKAQEFVGSDYPQGHDLDDEATFSGSFKLRFRNATLYDMAVAGPPGTAFSGEILWQIGATQSLSLLAPVLRLEPSGVVIPGPAGIEVDFNFRGEQRSDGTAAMLTATLKNQQASY